MAWKASWAHRTGENEEKKENDKIKKIGPNVERLCSDWSDCDSIINDIGSQQLIFGNSKFRLTDLFFDNINQTLYKEN